MIPRSLGLAHAPAAGMHDAWSLFIAPAQLTGAKVKDKGAKAHHAGLHRRCARQLSLRSAAQHRMDAPIESPTTF